MRYIYTINILIWLMKVIETYTENESYDNKPLFHNITATLGK